MKHNAARPTIAVCGLALMSLSGVADGQVQMFGYGPKSAQTQASIERRAIELAKPESVADISRTLAAHPHVAGTEGQIATRDYCLARMADWGLRTETAEYEVYLPRPTEIRLERVQPDPKVFDLTEPPIEQDPWSADPAQVAPQNGYAAAGDVTGELVYVNYALPADLKKLAELGVDLTDKVAIVRYGRCYRGNKVANVAAAGAVGCILYSDPMEDGFFRGDVYPKGPMRPPRCVQRGSIKLGPGDPTTPGWASLPGAERRDPAESPDLVGIPALPVGYGVADELLRALDGHDVPQEWQGSLSFRYHVGPGPVRVRVKIAHDGGYRRIFNTFGRITGTDFPDEWIIVGAHRDAWGCGAMDNVSGVASVLEAARICASLAREGFAPRRTLIFATWDAEEWGIIGSTEWVEHHRETLNTNAVAYVNQDVVAGGPRFGASASPSLKAMVRELARLVPAPDESDKSVFDVWTSQNKGKVSVGTPGGGSDHGPFFLGLGVPVEAHGFGGHSGIYHSIYDTTRWMETFGDPGYKRHLAAARLTTLAVLRLANADIVPFNYGDYGNELVQMVAELQKKVVEFESGAAAPGDEPATVRLNLSGLTAAAAEFQKAGQALARRIAGVTSELLPDRRLARVNRELRSVERALTRPGGVGASAVFRNVIFGLNGANAYARAGFPGVAQALDKGSASRAQQEIVDLTERIRTATGHLIAAATLLD